MASIVNINYLAVLSAAISNMIIGFLWYGPLFGKQLMDLMGFTPKSMKSMKVTPKQAIAGGFVSAVIMSYVMAHFVGYVQASSIMDGLQVGFWLWLGFVATVMIGKVLWEGKPFKLFAINSGYWLVAMIVMGGILAVWR